MSTPRRRGRDLEGALLLHLRAAGLPEPERQTRLSLPPIAPGRPRRTCHFDFAWPALKVSVEVHGGIWSRGRHNSGVGVTTDAEKAAHAQLQGWTLITVTDKLIDDGRAVELIRAAIERAQGYDRG